MTNLKNILRCYAMGIGIKGIGNTFKISRNTVRKYVRKYQESGLSLDKILSMSAERVDEIFTEHITRERKTSPRREALESLLPDYYNGKKNGVCLLRTSGGGNFFENFSGMESWVKRFFTLNEGQKQQKQ